jgi:transcriptional regulator with XRE-family HTH domain
MFARDVAHLVREARMLRQLTQSQLALLAGVSRGTIGRLEWPQRRSVRIESADRVLRALGVRLDLVRTATTSARARRTTATPLH